MTDEFVDYKGRGFQLQEGESIETIRMSELLRIYKKQDDLFAKLEND